MSLSNIKTHLEKLCIEVQEDLPEDVVSKVAKVRRLIIESPQWIQKTEHLQKKMLSLLFFPPTAHQHQHEPQSREGSRERNLEHMIVRSRINEADGALEEAIRIDIEERGQGSPKPINKGQENLSILKYSINLEDWLLYHGEGVIGPSWWMDNPEKLEDSWEPNEVVWLNRELQKYNGQPVGDETVFRFAGKGFNQLGKWTLSNDGLEYLFGVFALNKDPRTIVEVTKLLDIDLERWLKLYGEDEHPARMMCATEGLKEVRNLNKELKALDGTLVGETHVWRFVGKKTYKREGKIDLFRCERLPEVRET